MTGIIIPSRRLIFWSIPKNACSAIKAAIVKAEGLEVPEGRPVHYANFKFTDRPIDGLRGFVIFRDPVSRFYSLWKNKFSTGAPLGPGHREHVDRAVFRKWPERFWNRMNLRELIDSVRSIPKAQADPHFAPQLGQFPNNATVIRYEAAEPLMRLVLPDLNTSTGKRDVRPFVSDSVRRKIEAHYAEDLDFWRSIGGR